MDAAVFHNLVKNFTVLTKDEYSQIHELSRQYPYCQLIHMLESRASRDMQEKNQAEVLQLTAVYSADRAVVKWAMAFPPTERRMQEPTILRGPVALKEPVVLKEPVAFKVPVAESTPLETKPNVQPVTETPKAKPQVINTSPMMPSSLSGKALRDDLAKELSKLQKLKRDFENSYENLQRTLHHDDVPKVSKKIKPTKETEASGLIEELKSTRKPLSVEGSKQLEQQEIIDQFINAAPILPKAKPTSTPTDLSEESGNIGDSVISETLVAILLKQGKKAKAIEMLKKLIWKFPQKKAYFAAQISELKD